MPEPRARLQAAQLGVTLGLVAALIVNIDVDDLDKATTFYTRALALRVGRRFGATGVELLGAESPIFLLVAPKGSVPFRGGSTTRVYRRHWTPVHLDFAVQDIEAEVERALAAGATLEVPVERHGFGKMAVLADPFGHGFCLLQFEDGGYDAIATSRG